ncbi:MAG: hypothetical protein OEU92_13075 [Alphaproteobacteria bacterium]|nr:hypothetical protein [Alphaproteobacteria bacterium]
MRWTVLVTALALSACGQQSEERSPYLSLIENADAGPSSDVVFAEVEEHARCAGFHRASAGLAFGAETKVAFYQTAADDAETVAIQLASAKISKDLAAQMVDQMAKTHAARWSYLIAADAASDVVKHQATTCFDMADEQEKIIRELVKAKYGFSAQR